MAIVTLGIDLGKNVCSIAGLNAFDRVVMRHRIRRFLRKIFIHGARTVLHLVKDRSVPLTAWVDKLKARRHPDVAMVANPSSSLIPALCCIVLRASKYRFRAIAAPPNTAGVPPSG